MNSIEVPFFTLNFEKGNIIRAPKYCEPAPSSFHKSKSWTVDIEDTIIEFQLPKHKHWDKLAKPQYPEKKYNFNDMKFIDIFDDTDSKGEWQVAKLLSNITWPFYGPFLTGMLADITASFMILQHKPKSGNISNFHPRVFENTIIEFLTNSHSKEKIQDQYKYIAPTEWKTYDYFPVNIARFKVITNDRVTRYIVSELLFFTLDDNHLAYFVFNYNRYVPGAKTKKDYDKHMSDKHMIEIIDNVIDSIKISLSPKSRAQQEIAIKELADARLSTTFLPLNWDRKIDHSGSNINKLLPIDN